MTVFYVLFMGQRHFNRAPRYGLISKHWFIVNIPTLSNDNYVAYRTAGTKITVN